MVGGLCTGSVSFGVIVIGLERTEALDGSLFDTECDKVEIEL